MATERGRQPDGMSKNAVLDLHETFARLRRRHLRLGRLVRSKQVQADQLRKQSRGRVTIATARNRVGYHPAWLRWSDTYDEVASTADRLIRTRPRSLAELALVVQALEWILLSDAVVVDRGAEHQIRTFSRHLRLLAVSPS